MSDFKIHTQRSWEPSPEPKKVTSATESFFILPKKIDLSASTEQKINVASLFSQNLARDVHIDAKQYPMDEVVALLIQDYAGDGTMKSSQKKDATVESEEDVEPAVKEFAETLIESLKENYDSKLEPFEVYAAKVRGHIYGNAKSFKKRFAKGYQILLSELEKKSPPDSTAIKP